MKPASDRSRAGARRCGVRVALGAVMSLGGAWAALGQCVSSWQVASSNSPGARQQAAMVYDSARARVVLFGGFDLVARKGDTWAYNGSSWTRLTQAGPVARAGHAMAYDSARDRVVLFGGYDGSSLGDTWEFDGVAWALRSEGGPAARTEHAMAYDSARGRTVLLGGEVDGDQTWEWDGTGWQAMGIAGPAARIGHAMVYDGARGWIVMTLGRGPTGLRNGTWAYDGVSWRQIAASGPSARFYHAMLYDSVRDRIVLFGGTSTGATGLSDTWEFDGTMWSEPEVQTTAVRFGLPGVYDAARGVGVVFGGSTTAGNMTGETWRWSAASSPAIMMQPASMTVDEGATAVFESPAEGLLPLTYQWSFSGLAMVDGPSVGGEVLGATTARLEIRGVTRLAQGVYQCAVVNGCGMAVSDPAALVVRSRCPADVDDGSGTGTPDGGVTVDDVLFFLGVFGVGDARADLDDGSGTGTPDGGVTVDDMLFFLFHYNGGC